MSIADKLTTIAENEQKVYDAGMADGRQTEYDAFWDAYQNNGKSMAWGPSAFMGEWWNDKTFFPKYDIIPSTGASNSYFHYNCVTNLRERIDGRGLKLDLRNKPQMSMFFRQSKTCELPEMDTSEITHFTELVYQASKVHTIPKLNMTKALAVNNAFTGAKALQNITFEGSIPINISFVDCTLLTHESLMSIINALKDYSADESGKVYTCAIGSVNLAKLTKEEQQIAIDKGWVLS